MENNYEEAYKEVYEVLKKMPKEDLNKISGELREIYAKKKGENYDFKIDTEKNLENKIY